MSKRKRLIELIKESKTLVHCGCHYNNIDYYAKQLSDYLIDNGIVILPCKPIGVMTDGNDFSSDVYCPYCGDNLSGLYGDEPTEIIQCYHCGNFLDNTKVLSKEEAEKALAERRAE